MAKYLAPLIKRVTDDEFIINEASKLNSDEEILKLIKGKINIESIKEAFGKYYGVEYKSYSNADKNLIDKFDINLLKRLKALPYSYDKKNFRWLFLISDLTDRKSQAEIVKEINKRGDSVSFAFTFEHELEFTEDTYVRKEMSSPSNAVEWVNDVINEGIKVKASDIHIESVDGGVQVRYRVDGVLTGQQVIEVNESELSNIYVRLKLISDMDISEKRRSQDGRIDGYEYMSKSYSLRVSTINTIHGEKFAMRIMPEEGGDISFSALGFTEEQTDKISNMLNKSNGIVYLAGATGSGKTTTLYAMINQFNEKLLNIYTIESPVERGIEGVNQVQVDEAHGNTYPSALKTLLRQDPDILVVGEIREAETAKLAIQSSLTGHFVMTTIHANNALESITRLSGMGVEPYLIGASSVGFISQRLIRTLCEHCKVEVDKIPYYEEKWIKNIIKDFDYNEYKKSGKRIYRATGCDECIGGYKGRVAVVEIIEVDDELKDMIARNVGVKEINDYLESIDYKSMKHDGIDKALDGIVSISELIGKLQN